MDEHALTIKTVRDGPVCALILHGDLDLCETDGFQGQAFLAAGNRTGRQVLDLARVTFLNCAGVRRWRQLRASRHAAAPVIIRSLSPGVRRTLELLDLDAQHPARQPAPRTMTRTWAWQPVPRTCPPGARRCSRAIGGDADA
jgi:anti-anti-sigma factor